MHFDFVSMPTFKDLPGVGEQSYPTYISIPNISKNKDAAMKVVKFLTSDEFQTEISKKGNMTSLKNPAIQKLMGTDSDFKSLNYAAFFHNKFAPIANDDRVLASNRQSPYRDAPVCLPLPLIVCSQIKC